MICFESPGTVPVDCIEPSQVTQETRSSLCPISGKVQIETFADAAPAAADDKTPACKVSARVLTDPKDIAKSMQKSEESKCDRIKARMPIQNYESTLIIVALTGLMMTSPS